MWSYDELEQPKMKGMFAKEKATARNSDNVQRMLEEISPELIRAAIRAAVENGACVMFAGTRDNGAIVVTLLNGQERAKAYPTSTPELEQCLQDLAESCGADITTLLPKRPKPRQ